MLNQDFFQSPKPLKPQSANNYAEKKVRAVRGDKIKDVKFPVTPEQRVELRKRAAKAKNETVSNTTILLAALHDFRLHPEKYPQMEYRDTGTYMHAKIRQRDFDILEELYLDLNEHSRRSFTTRLVMNYIGMGAVQ